MPELTFVLKDGTRKKVTADAGQSVMSLAKRHNLDMEGACEGCLACGTCHVYVEAQWAERLTSPDEEELDMLELTVELRETSRLACQITVNAELDGLTVIFPKGQVPNLLVR